MCTPLFIGIGHCNVNKNIFNDHNKTPVVRNAFGHCDIQHHVEYALLLRVSKVRIRFQVEQQQLENVSEILCRKHMLASCITTENVKFFLFFSEC